MNEDMNVNDLIVDEIKNRTEANDRFCITVELKHPDGSTTDIEVSGELEWDGYMEDDYFDGTGCWVTTYANATVSSVEISSYDEDGFEIGNPTLDIDTRYIERELKDWLDS